MKWLALLEWLFRKINSGSTCYLHEWAANSDTFETVGGNQTTFVYVVCKKCGTSKLVSITPLTLSGQSRPGQPKELHGQMQEAQKENALKIAGRGD